MPGDIDKMVNAAKGALAQANTKFPSPKPAAAAAPAPAPKAAPKPGLNDELKAKQANVNEYAANVPTMHKGGIVTSNGPHSNGGGVLRSLQPGEVVLPSHPDVHKFLMKKGIASLGPKNTGSKVQVAHAKSTLMTASKFKAEKPAPSNVAPPDSKPGTIHAGAKAKLDEVSIKAKK
jgi:hypothetical protein